MIDAAPRSARAPHARAVGRRSSGRGAKAGRGADRSLEGETGLDTAPPLLKTRYSRVVETFGRITVNPAICEGRACVRGLRMPVSVVLRHLAAGQSAEQIVAEYPDLELADIPDCLRYAAWLASPRTADLPQWSERAV
jgi:uncharacterized protein (DUF433 family)